MAVGSLIGGWGRFGAWGGFGVDLRSVCWGRSAFDFESLCGVLRESGVVLGAIWVGGWIWACMLRVRHGSGLFGQRYGRGCPVEGLLDEVLFLGSEQAPPELDLAEIGDPKDPAPWRLPLKRRVSQRREAADRCAVATRTVRRHHARARARASRGFACGRRKRVARASRACSVTSARARAGRLARRARAFMQHTGGAGRRRAHATVAIRVWRFDLIPRG